MPAALSPAEGMAVCVPVRGCLLDGLADLLPSLKAPPSQREGAEHLPPRLDQVQIGRICGLEDELPPRVGQAEQQHISGPMGTQVIGDGIDPLDLGREPALNLLKEGHPMRGAPARVGMREGGSRGGLKGTEDVALGAPAVIDLLPGSAGRVCVRTGWRPG